MPDPTPAELAYLLAVICDPALSRLRPRVVGRPHPIHRLPRLQRHGLVRGGAAGSHCARRYATENRGVGWPLPAIRASLKRSRRPPSPACWITTLPPCGLA